MSKKNSFKNHSEFSSNSTTLNNKNNNYASIVTPDKSIKLNEFLDFLNLSCHVNDMISHNNDEYQRPLKEHIQTDKSSSVTDTTEYAQRSKTYGNRSPFNFQKLSQHYLINNLNGFNYKIRLADANKKDNNASSSGNTALQIQQTAEINLKTKSSSINDEGLHLNLNEKLDYVLNEGILDAVLPFICPIPLPANYTTRLKPKQNDEKDQMVTTSISLTHKSCEYKNGETTTGPDCNSDVSSKSSTSKTESLELREIPDIVIHVCDEVKNTKKDFKCPQNLLISKMGYFADVATSQKLEDMDISVHCDIEVFEWLMNWVKSESGINSNPNVAPDLNVNNVVPIIVSACFLQMEPLLLDCLSFCHSHLADVIKISTNVSSLNDTLITRMAAMFTNVELERVPDKKHRLLSRLWTKLICSLFEPETEALRGHYYSLAGLFKCSKCQKCLTNTMKSYAQCIPGNARLNRWGQVVNYHVHEPSWDVNYYITQLFREVKSWRLVYWKLWGHAHYLYCCLCEMYFPVYQMSCCPYHPESPSFSGPIGEGRSSGPVGRYACCGQQAFRYETLPGPHGCQFRDHSVLVETHQERSILSIVQLAFEENALGEFLPQQFHEIYANEDIRPRWMDITLIPDYCRQGLLPIIKSDESSTLSVSRLKKVSSKCFADSGTESEVSDTLDNMHISKFRMDSYDDSFSTNSSDDCDSSDSKIFTTEKNYQKNHKEKSKRLENPGRYWSCELSARSNQDHQRDFEEKVMKHVITKVQKKTGSDLSFIQQNEPLGGTYVKLEQEWKKQLKQRIHTLGSSASTNTQLGTSNNISVALNIKGSRRKVDGSGH